MHLTEQNSLILVLLFPNKAKTSIAITNKNGYIGSPCLTPFCNSKYFDKIPSFRTHALTSLYKTFIQFTKDSPKLNYFKALKEKIPSNYIQSFFHIYC